MLNPPVKANSSSPSQFTIIRLPETLSPLFPPHIRIITPAEKIASDLGSTLSPSSSIYLPSDENWTNETTQRWNQWNAPSYVVSVKPAIKEDVQKVLQYAARNKVPFLATGGGHGYSGTLGALNNGLELDMGYFKSVKVDAGKNRLIIGGSVRFRELISPVYAAGKAFPVGACPCVGASGASLGGGIGFWSGFYGAISDSLVSVEIVTGTGTLLTASESQNSDLFWAVKGAGHNFGVVTSFTFKVYDSPNGGQAMNADMTFPLSRNGSLWAFAKSFAGKQPKELSLGFSILASPVTQELVIVVNAIYVGPLAQGRALIKPLLDLTPQNTNISYIAWKDVPYAAKYGGPAKSCDTRPLDVPHAVNLYQVDIEGLTAAVEYLNDTIPNTPALKGTVFALTQYSTYGFQQHTPDSSAFPYRDVIIFAQIDVTASKSSDLPTINSFTKSFRDRLQKISGKDHLEVYTNLAHGDEGAAAWYSKKNVPRLRKLKKTYDPSSLFNFYNSVNVD
ncbi:FAD-binding domain-containing protein [Mytilinidion resinicola]|uniref:FAD-binding domain-containing protein n=1 Tax=Mytilinidion resinicola TaxID=574789 RepID=A0A6A6Z6Q5_9PEZI|nr:FAD-binding domain-containing protein [Mytilinidion resinicola]KAF2816389.1 FAD-binding domain-containing protein [Mytilinidion resinicola]